MISRQAKAAFYALAGPVMTVNGWIWRRFRTPRVSGDLVRVHLGPGRQKYMQGWVNVDANMFTGKCDVWADLRNPLPFADGSVDAVYSHHVIEHLPDMWAHFRDVHRVLKPGGVYRVAGPNGESAARKLLEGDHSWFPGFPDDFDSIGGRFVNFVFCRNEHLTMLTESFIQEIATKSGFPEGKKRMQTKETDYPHLFEDCLATEFEKYPDCPQTILIEFTK